MQTLILQLIIHQSGLPAILQKALAKYLAQFDAEPSSTYEQRMAGLLKDLAPEIRSESLRVHGHRRQVKLQAWAWALDAVVAQVHTGKLASPLTSHEHLYQTVLSYDPREHGGISDKTQPNPEVAP